MTLLNDLKQKYDNANAQNSAITQELEQLLSKAAELEQKLEEQKKLLVAPEEALKTELQKEITTEEAKIAEATKLVTDGKYEQAHQLLFPEENQQAVEQKPEQNVIYPHTLFEHERFLKSRTFEEKISDQIYTFDESIQRLRASGQYRHPSPQEIMAALADYQEKRNEKEGSKYKQLFEEIKSGKIIWLNLEARIMKNKSIFETFLSGSVYHLELASDVEDSTKRMERKLSITDRELKGIRNGCQIIYLSDGLVNFFCYPSFEKGHQLDLMDVAIHVKETYNPDEWLPVVLEMYNGKYLFRTTERTNKRSSLGVKVQEGN